MHCESWSITTSPSSASAANVRSWAFPDPRCITGLRRSWHQHYGSWPGRIDALYLEDLFSGSRQMVDYLAREGIPISRDRVQNLMRRIGLRAIYQKPRTTVPGKSSERFPCLWMSARSRLRIRSGPSISPPSRCSRDSSTWWQSFICSRETSSAGSSRTTLTRSSVWMAWRWET